jgi:hypothetical protein
MSPFRRVSGAEAGPSALGVLVPPGRRTTVILRPRSLDYDLLPLRPAPVHGSSVTFLEVSRMESENVARRVHQALESWVGDGVGRVEAVALTTGAWWVRAEVGPFTFLACRRSPGQSYQPAEFAAVEEARELALGLAAVLCPAESGSQEIYFNTRNFAE